MCRSSRRLISSSSLGQGMTSSAEDPWPEGYVVHEYRGVGALCAITVPSLAVRKVDRNGHLPIGEKVRPSCIMHHAS